MADCPHFWSAVDTAGMMTCAWCFKRIRSPIVWHTDNTTAPKPPQSEQPRTTDHGGGDGG